MFYNSNLSGFASQYTETDAKDASLGDVFRTAKHSAKRSYELYSEKRNLEQAYDERINKIRDATGVSLTNPASRYGFEDREEESEFYEAYKAHKRDGGETGLAGYSHQFWQDKFEKQAVELAGKHPDRAADITPQVKPIARAREIARQSEETELETYERSDNPLRLGAWFAGGLAAAIEDPVNIATLPLGFSGRTAWGAKGLLTAAVKSGATNAAIEAGIQPKVQQFRAEAGLQSGIAPAAIAVGAAFTLGGVLDPLIRGTYRGVRTLKGYEPTIDKDGFVSGYKKKGSTAKSPDIPAADIQKAADGDLVATRRVLEKTGDIDEPEIRGALQAAEADAATVEIKPRERISDQDHALAVEQSLRHIAEPETEPPPVVVDRPDPPKGKQLDDAVRTEVNAALDNLAKNPLALARVLRRQDDETLALLVDDPEYVARVNDKVVRDSESLSRLSDDAFSLVESGDVSPRIGSIVASHAPDKTQHARLAQDLAARKPVSEDQARRTLGVLMQERAANIDGDPVVRAVTGAPLSPDRAARVVSRNFDKVTQKNEPHMIDDPFGAEAERQIADLEARFADELDQEPEAKAGAEKPQSADIKPEKRETFLEATSLERLDDLPGAPKRLASFADSPNKDPLGFTSKALNAAKSLKQEKGTPEQMLSQLKKAGVKEAELEATGLNKLFHSDGETGANAGAVNLPIKKEANEAIGGTNWVLDPPWGYLSGHVDDGASILKIQDVKIDESARGKGSGIKLYESVIDDALESGLTVVSDTAVSKSATRVYDALKRRGYVVKKNPHAVEGDRGTLRTHDLTHSSNKGPVFTITGRSGDRTNASKPKSPRVNQITKSQIIKHLEDNRVEVREVVRADFEATSEFERIRELKQMRRWVAAHEPSFTERLKGKPTSNELARQINEAEDAFVKKYGHRPGQKETRWSSYSVDPTNPTYKETVLHLPAREVSPVVINEASLKHFKKPYSALDDSEKSVLETFQRSDKDEFKIGDNFTDVHFSEPNIILHGRTSELIDSQGNKVFNVDELQSGWGQKLRDGGVRDEAKIAKLKEEIKIIDEQLAILNPTDNSNNLTIKERKKWYPVREKRDLLDAEIRTAEAATPGNPLVNTTDQWVNIGLKRMITQAIESGADKISIPSGATVIRYGMGGKESGLNYAYNEMYPKKLEKLLRKMDKTIKPERVDQLGSPSGKKAVGKGFTTFKITDAVRAKVASEGQPLFFQPVNVSKPYRFRQTGRTAGQMAGIRREVEALLDDMLPGDVRARVEDGMIPQLGGRDTQGLWDGVERMVYVALAADDPVQVARHEVVHALKQSGLMTSREFDVLYDGAERLGLRKSYDIDKQYKATYAENTNSKVELEALLREETVAHMFAERIDTGRRFSDLPGGAAVDKIFDVIAEFIERLKNMLKGRGFTSVRDVFENIESGAIAARGEDLQSEIGASVRFEDIADMIEACR